MSFAKIKRFFSGRRTRYALLCILCALAILALLACNVLFTYVSKKNNYFADLTPEGLYTMTDLMESTMESIETDITITFCSDPDVLYASNLLRHVYILALELQKRNDHIKVETVNIAKEPEKVDAFRTTGASKILPTDVIFSSGARYAIYGQNTFWSTQQDGTALWAFQGEYKMATGILTVAASSLPAAYFSVGHGEMYYDPNDADNPDNEYLAEFYRLLIERGMTVGTVNLETEEIPEDCSLLIIIEPESDFEGGDLNSLYERPALEKLDRYLCGEHGAAMVFLDTEHTLENLNEFLAEWGVGVGEGIVTDSKYSIDQGRGQSLIATYANPNDESAVGYFYYQAIADLVAPPKTILKDVRPLSLTFSEEDGYEFHYDMLALSRGVSPFFLSSAGAENKVPNAAGGFDSLSVGSFPLATISTQVHTINETDEHFSYLFTSGTSELISTEFLANAAYANRDIMGAVLREITRNDVYAPLELGSTDAKYMSTEYAHYGNYGGTILQGDTFDASEGITFRSVVSYLVLLLMPALAAPIVCIAIRLRRRYL